jgi:hypothetical protein
MARKMVTPEPNVRMVRTLYDDMQTDAGATPVTVCVQRLAVSLAQVYLGQRDKLDLPLPGLPLAHSPHPWTNEDETKRNMLRDTG